MSSRGAPVASQAMWGVWGKRKKSGIDPLIFARRTGGCFWRQRAFSQSGSRFSTFSPTACRACWQSIQSVSAALVIWVAWPASSAAATILRSARSVMRCSQCDTLRSTLPWCSDGSRALASSASMAWWPSLPTSPGAVLFHT